MKETCSCGDEPPACWGLPPLPLPPPSLVLSDLGRRVGMASYSLQVPRSRWPNTSQLVCADQFPQLLSWVITNELPGQNTEAISL